MVKDREMRGGGKAKTGQAVERPPPREELHLKDHTDKDELEEKRNEKIGSTKRRVTGEKGLSVKPSPAFVALNEKLLSAGKVSSVRLNLNAGIAPGGIATKKIISGSDNDKGSGNDVGSGSGSLRGVVSTKVRHNAIEEAQASSSLYDATASTVPSLKTEREIKKKTLGKGWFDLEPAVMDETLKRDIKMIQMRNYIDPKRFYKNPDKSKAVLHVGTVVEGVGEYKSSRMTNKERQSTILGEILADKQIKQYAKRKYAEIQESRPQRKRKGHSSKQKKVRKLF